MGSKITIKELLDQEIAFMGSNWVEDPNAPKDSPLPGHRYAGEKPCINCNDFFYWACADAEDISEETLPLLHKAVDDCNGDVSIGALLYCARQRKERPQGPYYSLLPKDLWSLFNECGPEREVDFGNPCKPGEYK